MWGRHSSAQAGSKPPRSVVLDINDTVDVVHGHQQLAQWNAHYDERRLLPIHVYDTATGRPVTVILRPGKTPSGMKLRKLLGRLIGRIRRHWGDTHISINTFASPGGKGTNILICGAARHRNAWASCIPFRGLGSERLSLVRWRNLEADRESRNGVGCR
jgi:hypothetical protein